MAQANRAAEWNEYYDAFPYFSGELVRSGCGPKVMLHPGGSEKAIVLVHGLTDSPYAMEAIGRYFFENLHYDVYLPLLHCHGLKEPRGMEGVSLAEWKANVQFALGIAASSSATVSLGGLSTGGALSFYFGATDSRVTGEIYLFSAAFSLYGGPGGRCSKFLEFLLMTPLVKLYSRSNSLVGRNPYRYDKVPLLSARQLVILMRENRQLMYPVDGGKPFDTRVFSAWSESDRVVSTNALRAVGDTVGSQLYSPFIIAKDLDVHHACVVLDAPVYQENSGLKAFPLELANPRFALMMEAVRQFEQLV